MTCFVRFASGDEHFLITVVLVAFQFGLQRERRLIIVFWKRVCLV